MLTLKISFEYFIRMGNETKVESGRRSTPLIDRYANTYLIFFLPNPKTLALFIYQNIVVERLRN